MRLHASLILLSIYFGACSNQESKVPEQAICPECQILFLLPGEDQHYRQANFGSEVLDVDLQTSSVLWTGALSTNWDLRRTSTHQSTMPWFEVIYSLTGKAWIHGSQINLNQDENAFLLDTLDQLRKEQVLGPPLYQAIKAYEAEVAQATSPVKLASLILKSETIRAEMKMAEELNVEVNPSSVDLFGHTWLSSFETSSPTLFRDFPVFEFITEETPEAWDNDCLSLFYF
ncbi:MAG: hypothetical protein AAF598_12940, partial [Bacteroidota bacterium]